MKTKCKDEYLKNVLLMTYTNSFDVGGLCGRIKSGSQCSLFYENNKCSDDSQTLADYWKYKRKNILITRISEKMIFKHLYLL